MSFDPGTPENPESSVPAAAAPKERCSESGGFDGAATSQGRGLEALFSPPAPFPLHEAGIVLQALAMQQLERIERPNEEDDVRCNACLVTWVRNGVPRPHLESCMVGRALHLAELALNGQSGQQVPMVAAGRFAPVELLVWARPDAPTDKVLVPGELVVDHHERAELVEGTSAFPKTLHGCRIVEVPVR